MGVFWEGPRSIGEGSQNTPEPLSNVVCFICVSREAVRGFYDTRTLPWFLGVMFATSGLTSHFFHRYQSFVSRRFSF